MAIHFTDILPNSKNLFYGDGPATAAGATGGVSAQAGDVMINDSLTRVTGDPVAWLCTAAGDPGTWEAVYSGGIQYAEVSIAAAALATLRATPVTLVAAPGAGKILQFLGAELILDWVTPGFTETTDNMAVKYVDGSGVAVSQAIECTGFIDQVADTKTNALPKIDVIATKAQSENVPLVLHNTGDGEWGGSGGSALRVKISYRTVNSGW